MSTLQKTINLLSRLPEKQIENIYSYVQFVSSQQEIERLRENDDVEDALNHLIGIIPDNNKSLEEYREERIKERYGYTN